MAGPEAIGLDELIRRVLTASGDQRPVVTDDSVPYFGEVLVDSTLTPGPGARLGPTQLDDWLREPDIRPAPGRAVERLEQAGRPAGVPEHDGLAVVAAGRGPRR